MPIIQFPPHETASSDGLLAIGGDLSLESLLLAYTNGIFPWPLDEHTLAWFSPRKRALIYLDEFHIPKSLDKLRKKNPFKFSFNTRFKDVIQNCAVSKNRKGNKGTWITPDIIASYCKLFDAGFAFSVECLLENELVAGMYGVTIGNMVAGESMFYLVPNASKLTLCFLMDHLKLHNIKWFDCQVMNANVKRFGAKDVKRNDFLSLLEIAIKEGNIWLNKQPTST
jgi:leucyl/phenylalanyl-tRNA---protein transferase